METSGIGSKTGLNRKGTLHVGRVIDLDDEQDSLMVHWRDIDDASFA